MPLKDYRRFAQANSFGTQLEMALYIHDLYEQGYDFAKTPSNYAYRHYKSPLDQKERFFAHHRFAKKWYFYLYQNKDADVIFNEN